MKTVGVVHLGSFKIFKSLRENLAIVIFAIIFCLGVLISVFLYSKNYFLSESDYICDAFDSIRSLNHFSKIFFPIFIFEFTFLFAIFIFGSSLLGMAFIPFIIFIRGIFSGLLLVNLYSNHGLTGITLNLLTLLPSTVVFVLTYITGAGYMLNISYSISKLLISSKHNVINFKSLMIKFGIFVLIITMGALLEAFSILVFKRFFA